MKAYDELAPHRPEPKTFRFAADGHRGCYLLEDNYCEEALCPGSEMRVRLTEHGAPGHVISFDVDRETGEASWDEDAPFRDQAIANEFAQSRANLRLLERRRQIVRAWGLTTWNGPVLRRESRCYTLQDFAYEREPFLLPFAHAGKEWVALDQYCVNPLCDCQEVILSFYRNETTKEPAEAVFNLSVTVPGAEAQPLEGRPPEKGAVELLDGMKAEIDRLGPELGARRALIRATARRRLREPEASGARDNAGSSREPVLATGSAKTGRNDPCPCASGAKFKRCCGA